MSGEFEEGIREQGRLDKVAQLHSDHARARMDWRKHLRRTKKGGQFLGDVANVVLALEHAPELVGLLRFNELARCIELIKAPPWRTLTTGKRWRDEDDVDLLSWLQTWDVPVRGDGTIARVVQMMAVRNSVHPVREWLEALTWDGEPRICEVLPEVLCARGPAQYLQGVLKRFMLSAIARAMQPGCKADHMLVLIGAQGTGKSTFAQVLGSPWVVESHSNFGSKDAAQELLGAWIVEVGELSSMKRPEVETVKTFVSRQVDHYRPAYGRHVIDQPRTCIFLATTNEEKFLLDATGNRRFWPVKCAGRIDLPLLRTHRLQLWAEAFAAYRAGESWFLTAEEERLATTIQEDHRVVGQVEEEVVVFLENLRTNPLRANKETTVREVYKGICGSKDQENLSLRRQLETAIGQAIRRCGWLYVGRKGPENRTTYAPPTTPSDNPDNP